MTKCRHNRCRHRPCVETHPKSNCILQFKTNTKHHHVENTCFNTNTQYLPANGSMCCACCFLYVFGPSCSETSKKTPRPRLRLRFTDLARRLSPTLDTNRYTSRARPMATPGAPDDEQELHGPMDSLCGHRDVWNISTCDRSGCRVRKNGGASSKRSTVFVSAERR